MTTVTLSPGAQLGPYTLLRRETAPDCVEVWLATSASKESDSPEVVRIEMPAEGQPIPEQLLDALRAVHRIRHPQISAPLGIVDQSPPGRPYWILRPPEGERLEDYSGWSTEVGLRLATNLAGALHMLHRHGVVHGALQMTAVWVDHGGQVTVGGFGWSALMGRESLRPADDVKALLRMIEAGGASLPSVAWSTTTASGLLEMLKRFRVEEPATEAVSLLESPTLQHRESDSEAPTPSMSGPPPPQVVPAESETEHDDVDDSPPVADVKIPSPNPRIIRRPTRDEIETAVRGAPTLPLRVPASERPGSVLERPPSLSQRPRPQAPSANMVFEAADELTEAPTQHQPAESSPTPQVTSAPMKLGPGPSDSTWLSPPAPSRQAQVDRWLGRVAVGLAVVVVVLGSWLVLAGLLP